MISAGGLFKAKKLEAAVATAAAEATPSPILLLRRRRRSLRCCPPACTGPGTPMGRACILFKYTGLQTALQRGSLIDAAMPALFRIPTNHIVNKDEKVNNIVLEKQ
jgi:hypothetical protein